MQDALELAALEARKAGASRVHRMRLRIGVLSGVVPEALQFAFDALSPGSAAEGAKLELETVPAVYECERCGRELISPEPREPCPFCGDSRTSLRSGLEMELTTVEVS